MGFSEHFRWPDPWPAASYAARVHAESEYPRESVGIVLDDGEYVPLVNRAPDPEKAFELSDDDLDPYRDRVAALIHSHPRHSDEINPRDGPLASGPSKSDMEHQQSMACPWAIVVVVDGYVDERVIWFGDQLPHRAPYLGRPFISGVYDCFSLVRDFYRGEMKVDLPDMPRDFTDVIDGADLYVPNLRAWGFDIVDQTDLQYGDVLLARVNADVTNHAMIWLGNELILHHIRHGLSGRQPLPRWRSHVSITHAVRYKR